MSWLPKKKGIPWLSHTPLHLRFKSHSILSINIILRFRSKHRLQCSLLDSFSMVIAVPCWWCISVQQLTVLINWMEATGMKKLCHFTQNFHLFHGGHIFRDCKNIMSWEVNTSQNRRHLLFTVVWGNKYLSAKKRFAVLEDNWHAISTFREVVHNNQQNTNAGTCSNPFTIWIWCFNKAASALTVIIVFSVATKRNKYFRGHWPG